MSEQKQNWVVILVAALGVVSAISVAIIGLYQHRETSVLTREQKALELSELILSEDANNRRQGLAKLSILYRDDPQGEKDILSRIHRFAVDSEKAQVVLGPGPSISPDKEQENAIIVSKDGSGNFRTLSDAINNAKNGEIIIIKNGIYYEDSLKFPKSGITIRGESKQKTVIVGTSGDPVFIPSNHSRIENMTVINEKYEIPYYRKTVVWISGVDGVEIRNNIFRGGGTGITVSKCILTKGTY